MATAAFEFNIAKGRSNELAKLGAANDALILVLIQTTGLESDATLKDYATLSALLAAANDECTFTGYARRTLASVVVAVNNTSDNQNTDAADPAAWTNSGGSAQGCGAAIVCYDDDTTGGTDANLIPLYNLLTGTVTFDIGVPVTPVFNAAGLYVAS
jgi:hypothetical protein